MTDMSSFEDLLEVTAAVKSDMHRAAATLQDTITTDSHQIVSGNISAECLREFASHVKEVREALQFLGDTRSHNIVMMEDMHAILTRIDLVNRDNCEKERDHWLQEKEVTDEIYKLSPSIRGQSIFEKTAVFEILEQQIAKSEDEMLNLKSNYERKLEHSMGELERLRSELLEAKDETDSVRCELDAVKTQTSSEYAALETKYFNFIDETDSIRRELDAVKTQTSSEYTALKIKYFNSIDEMDSIRRELNAVETQTSSEYTALETKYSNLIDETDSIRRELNAVKTQTSFEYTALETKHSNLIGTLEHLANKHIPKYMCPTLNEALPRMVHVFTTISQRCPWLFSALADENLNPNSMLPNPISLEIKQKLAVEQLVLERNSAQDKLHLATEEFRTAEEALALHLNSTTKELESAKQAIEKLENRITRYRHYMGELWSMYQASQMSSTNREMPCLPNLSSSSSQLSNQQHQATLVCDGTNNNVAQQSTTAEENVSPTLSSVGSTTNSSPFAVLSRVGQAVSAITTALISPRRNVTPTCTPKHTTTKTTSTSDTVKQTSTSPPGSAGMTVSQSGFSENRTLDLKLVNSTGIPSHPTTSRSHISENSPPQQFKTTTNPMTSHPFAVPQLPPSVAHHPAIGKRRPLSELPPVIDVIDRKFPSRDWKPLSPISRANSLSTKQEGFLPADSFIQVNPLAESTSSVPFAATHKRTRFDPPPHGHPTAVTITALPSTISRPHPIPSRLPSPRGLNRGQSDRQACNPS